MKWVSFIPAAYRRIVIRAAQRDLEPVYLSGKTGSGKSSIARWIHSNSPRGAKPYVLFSPGDDFKTKIQETDDGSLVIQDLERFSSEEYSKLQKLLRTRSLPETSEGEVRTLVRARLIVMGETPLDDFSSLLPLFKNFNIHLPSLSERGAELNDLALNLLTEMAHELKRDHVREISDEALEVLRSHHWRAGLRELRNIIRYGILRTKTARIEEAHLPNLRDPQGILLESRDGFRRVEEELKLAHPSMRN